MEPVSKTGHNDKIEEADVRRAPEPLDEERLDLIRRTKAMSIEERIDLFERMSRDAAWAKGTKRVG